MVTFILVVVLWIPDPVLCHELFACLPLGSAICLSVHMGRWWGVSDLLSRYLKVTLHEFVFTLAVLTPIRPHLLCRHFSRWSPSCLQMVCLQITRSGRLAGFSPIYTIHKRLCIWHHWLLFTETVSRHLWLNLTRRGGQMSRASISHAGRSGNPNHVCSNPYHLGLNSDRIKPMTLNKINAYCFLPRHSALLGYGKDWLALWQDNVT